LNVLEALNRTPTFTVNGTAAWQQWRNNAAGNDYKSVLIDCPAAPLEVVAGVDLGASYTKYVSCTPGTVLNVATMAGGATTDAAAFVFKYSGTQAGTSIDGVNVIGLITNASGAGFWSLFINCANITNCAVALSSSQNSSLTAFQNCEGIEDTTAEVDAASATLEQDTYYGCHNLNNCSGVATGGGTAYAFKGCTGLARCKGPLASTSATFDSTCRSVFGNPPDFTALGGWNEN
jgi:hypothetical protein